MKKEALCFAVLWEPHHPQRSWVLSSVTAAVIEFKPECSTGNGSFPSNSRETGIQSPSWGPPPRKPPAIWGTGAREVAAPPPVALRPARGCLHPSPELGFYHPDSRKQRPCGCPRPISKENTEKKLSRPASLPPGGTQVSEHPSLNTWNKTRSDHLAP